jgi:hypothetical protein
MLFRYAFIIFCAQRRRVQGEELDEDPGTGVKETKIQAV